MKVGIIKEFYLTHPFVVKLNKEGKILAQGKNMLDHPWKFVKLGHFLFTISVNRGIASIERIGKSEKKLMMMSNEVNELQKKIDELQRKINEA